MLYMAGTLFALWSGVNLIGIVLLLLGMGLIILEMLLPGIGLPGIAGAICLIAGLFLAAETLAEGLLLAVIVAVILLVALVLVIRSAQKGKLAKSSIVLNHAADKAQGYVPAEDKSKLLGARGRAITPLRPAGIGEFDGKRVDVVTEGAYIGRDEEITVTLVDGQRIVVEKNKD